MSSYSFTYANPFDVHVLCLCLGGISQTIKKNHQINKLNKNMVLDRILWRKLVRVADFAYWNKTWLLLLCFWVEYALTHKTESLV